MLEGLNEAQRQAVLHHQGRLLILAGAGSGKTRVITMKIAWLIRDLGCDPRSILALTFTNKAAQEMRQRAAQLEPRAEDVLIKTFHSFGAWMLRRNAMAAGLDPHFSIYDDDDVLQVLSLVQPQRPPRVLKSYAHEISRAKDYAQGPDYPGLQRGNLPDFIQVYEAYEQKLGALGNVDFGDLILRPQRLLLGDGALRQRFVQRFRVILVDEYQDSNVAQFSLLQALSGPDTYLCVVGDDDQSIYRFRGAEVRNILDFPQVFPGTDVIRLEENYRSTQPILALADAVVRNNQNRLGKTMFTRQTEGRLPELWTFGDQDAEVAAIVDRLIRDPRETAILYRTNAQSRVFEAALLRAGIPYRMVGTTRFYEREEVKDVIALLRLLANPRDEVSFLRIINKPARGLGDKAQSAMVAAATSAGGDLVRGTEYAIPGLSKKAAQGAADFVKLQESLARALAEGRNDLGELVLEAVNTSGLLAYHKDQDEVGGSQKEQNLEELVNAASLYAGTLAGLADFLEDTELDARLRDEEEGAAGTTLITMHNTKGLEFDRVIISGMEEGLFPRFDDSAEELEEQRRLLYVALTRARHELILTHTRFKRVFGRSEVYEPSRFLREMPPDLLDHPAAYRGMTVLPDPALRRGGLRSGSSRVSAGPVDEWAGYDSGSSGGDSGGEGGGAWLPGDQLRHETYGLGCVVDAGRRGKTFFIMVEFTDGRRMKFIPEFAPLHRVD